MKKVILVLPLSLALASSAPLRAGEHPEHPTGAPAQQQTDKPSDKKEHPAAAGQEHPAGHDHAKEHPAAKKKHPAGHEHPVGSKAWNSQMRKEFNKVVEDHVKRESAAEGAFKIEDDKLGKEWALKLIGVHKKRIVGLGGNSFFACADFKPVEKGSKDKLDLDFYATRGPDGWKIDRTVLHKVNGKPRYTYNEKNEMVPAKD